MLSNNEFTDTSRDVCKIRNISIDPNISEIKEAYRKLAIDISNWKG